MRRRGVARERLASAGLGSLLRKHDVPGVSFELIKKMMMAEVEVGPNCGGARSVAFTEASSGPSGCADPLGRKQDPLGRKQGQRVQLIA